MPRRIDRVTTVDGESLWEASQGLHLKQDGQLAHDVKDQQVAVERIIVNLKRMRATHSAIKRSQASQMLDMSIARLYDVVKNFDIVFKSQETTTQKERFAAYRKERRRRGLEREDVLRRQAAKDAREMLPVRELRRRRRAA
jgi:hypothetical protein